MNVRHLERALETGLLEHNAQELETKVDDIISKTNSITIAESTKLHNALYKLWQSDLVQSENDFDKHSILSQTISDDEYIQKFENRVENSSRAVLFLEILTKLQHLLINPEQLSVWWDTISVYAIDSNGYSNHAVKLSKQFINAVLTGSAYSHTDDIDPALVSKIGQMYAQKVLEILISNKLPPQSRGERSDERMRSLRLNCRNHFTLYLKRNTNMAFCLLNDFFLNPEYRLQILDFLVESLSQAQNSKLFRVYETPFFESLLLCLENDYSKLVLQSALTVLSMLVVHICAKLADKNLKLLCRVLAILGRCCCWVKMEYPDMSHGWQVYHDSTPTGQDESIKIIPLFTFLYGLFPINTLQFGKDPQLYLERHNFNLKFTDDFWTPKQITLKFIEAAKQFRLDPLIMMGTAESEIEDAIPRFQELGSSLEITSVCMARHIIVADDEENEFNGLQARIQEHREYFEMNAEGTAAHWHRELLLIRNELAFANFTKYMSNLRALRWQKRASKEAVTASKNECLQQKINQLIAKSNLLEQETISSVRKAQELLQSKSVYETQVAQREVEFKQQITCLETKNLELDSENKDLKTQISEANSNILQNEDKVSILESELKLLRADCECENSLKSTDNTNTTLQSDREQRDLIRRLETKLEKYEFKLKTLKDEHAEQLKRLETELAAAYSEMSEKITESSQQVAPSVHLNKHDHISRLRAHNEELVARCSALEREARSRRIFEEERFSELHAAFLTPRSGQRHDSVMENRFKGRGGVQGIPRNKSTTSFQHFTG